MKEGIKKVTKERKKASKQERNKERMNDENKHVSLRLKMHRQHHSATLPSHCSVLYGYQ
jgi:hypothetical protein